MSLFVGRLPTYDFDDRDLEDIFYKYGRIIKCQIKRGSRFSFGFVEFEDPEDAYDAMRNVDGLDIDGVPIVVERTKSSPRRSNDSSTCFNCGRYGHWARDCLEPSNDDDYYRRRSRSRYRDDYDRSRSYSRSRSPYGRRRYDDYYSRSRSRSLRRYGRSRSPYGRYYSRSRSPSRD